MTKKRFISGLSRRTFIVGGLALATGCTRMFTRAPPLRDLYGAVGTREQPPLILIPGAFGSRLLDERTGREVWPGRSARLLLSNYRSLEVGIDEETLEPVTTGIRPYAVFEQGLGRDFYGQALRTLEAAGGFARRTPGNPVEPGQRNYYVFLYDWRLDNATAARGLHDLIERIRADYRDPALRVDILAHSNGGLLARYYARYGTADHLDSGLADPTCEGASAIRRLLLVGVPNLGSMQPVLSHVRGEEIGLRRIPAEVVATTTGAPQMMPHPGVPWLVDVRGEPVRRELFDIETWRDFRWSVFDPRVRERTIGMKGGGAAGRRYLVTLERFLAKHLVRGKHFMQLLARETPPEDVRPFVFGGDCEPTVARLVLEEQRGRFYARETPESVVNPVGGMDYDGLIHDPGDSVVTRASLLGRCRPAHYSGCDGIARLESAHSFFLCEKHQLLTGNPSFQNNLLHTLFREDNG